MKELWLGRVGVRLRVGMVGVSSTRALLWALGDGGCLWDSCGECRFGGAQEDGKGPEQG